TTAQAQNGARPRARTGRAKRPPRPSDAISAGTADIRARCADRVRGECGLVGGQVVAPRPPAVRPLAARAGAVSRVRAVHCLVAGVAALAEDAPADPLEARRTRHVAEVLRVCGERAEVGRDVAQA